VLDDHAGGLGEGFDALQSGVGICHIVVGQLLALQLAGAGDAHIQRFGFDVEGGFLVGVFAVAHFLLFEELQVEGVGKVALFVFSVAGAEVVGNHAVVLAGVLEGLDHQSVAGGVGQLAAVAVQLVENGAVVAGVDHDGHVLMVLGR